MAGGALPLLAISVVVLLLLFPMVSTACTDSNKTEVIAIFSRQKSIDRSDVGVLKVLAEVEQKIQLVGVNLCEDFEISFTPSKKESLQQKDCDSVKRTSAFKPSAVNSRGSSAEYVINLDTLKPGEELYNLCVKQDQKWEYRGEDPWLQIAIKEPEEIESTIFPLPVQVLVIISLLFLSGLFSGLNLGLMALDKTELQIIEKCGSPVEKKNAKAITPLRKRGNFLLCTLLLGNVMVNSTATILLDDLSNGVVAVVVSTICIVVFGEIIPQAVCSRHGLAVGAKTAWITRFFMLVTFPLSFPISLLLDKVLGEEIGQVYDKEKLQELIRMTTDHKVLQTDEANIIAGALQLANKRVEDVMTQMEDVYQLDINTVLDFETMAEILKSGFTRVPVYDGDMTNIVHLLNTKELALIDPDDHTPLKTVCRFYDHKPLFVDYDLKLDTMLQDFLQAGNSHMAIVQRLQNEGDHDPFYENIGVVTLEDVIEEIIQSEIVDETDILTDNRRKKPRQRQKQLEYNMFEQKQEHGPRISQQVAFAAYQFLSTAVEPFKDQYVARNVLKQLVQQNIFITMTLSADDPSKNFIYKRGQECDFFVLLLEGHVEVEIGKENLKFESGPFNYFGVECLDCLRDMKIDALKESRDLRTLTPYIPDFSVRMITQVQFLRIRRVHYLAARRTSHLRVQDENSHEEAFHKEWNRTVASQSLSRNNSASAMSDLVDPGSLNMVHNALMSDPGLKDRITANSTPHHEQEKKVRGESVDSLKMNSSVSSGIDQTSKGPSSDGVVADVPSVSFSNGRTKGDKGGEDSPLLPNNTGDSDQKISAESELSSPEEGGGGAVVEDRVPLVSAKESRTTPSGQSKGWVEDDDESSPLVGKEKGDHPNVKS
ncbi:hypothetical protein V1264_014225 [Littorina saxatilis]|uniref:CNNM transmembrane domain-containing protein n=3 Tax=Littorina saxatilis TaxID=31220 RepID=A0AAN9BQN6_9CAEN